MGRAYEGEAVKTVAPALSQEVEGPLHAPPHGLPQPRPPLHPHTPSILVVLRDVPVGR